MKDSFINAEISEPYAKALMSLAQSSDLTDRIGDDISFLLGLLSESDELRQFLASPLIKPDVKKGVLRQLTSEQVHSYTLNFLLLLVDRGRILFLEDVSKQYQALLRNLNQTVLAEVVSAVELSDNQKEAVRQRVVEMTKAVRVELEANIDPDLIGGVIIRVGSQVIDASLRGQLRRIGLRLSSAA